MRGGGGGMEAREGRRELGLIVGLFSGICLNRSFTYNIKSSGPSMVPCGTPQDTYLYSNFLLSSREIAFEKK